MQTTGKLLHEILLRLRSTGKTLSGQYQVSKRTPSPPKLPKIGTFLLLICLAEQRS